MDKVPRNIRRLIIVCMQLLTEVLIESVILGIINKDKNIKLVSF